jgi:hypothetical protein
MGASGSSLATSTYWNSLGAGATGGADEENDDDLVVVAPELEEDQVVTITEEDECREFGVLGHPSSVRGPCNPQQILSDSAKSSNAPTKAAQGRGAGCPLREANAPWTIVPSKADVQRGRGNKQQQQQQQQNQPEERPLWDNGFGVGFGYGGDGGGGGGGLNDSPNLSDPNRYRVPSGPACKDYGVRVASTRTGRDQITGLMTDMVVYASNRPSRVAIFPDSTIAPHVAKVLSRGPTTRSVIVARSASLFATSATANTFKVLNATADPSRRTLYTEAEAVERIPLSKVAIVENPDLFCKPSSGHTMSMRARTSAAASSLVIQRAIACQSTIFLVPSHDSLARLMDEVKLDAVYTLSCEGPRPKSSSSGRLTGAHQPLISRFPVHDRATETLHNRL